MTLGCYVYGMVRKVGQYAAALIPEAGDFMTVGNDSHAPDWAAVQLDYEQGNGTLGVICTRHGITEAQLRFRRERHGWHMRHDWSMRTAPLINRMMRVLDAQVRALEKQMDGPIDKSAALLGTMTKTLEKLMQLEEKQKAKVPGQRKELSDLREKLVARIEQLKRQR